MALNDTQTHKKCFGETVLTLMTVSHLKKPEQVPRGARISPAGAII